MVWDDEDYWNIDQRKRDRYWYFPTGRTDAGEKTYFRAQKPPGLAAFSIATERVCAGIFGMDPKTGEFGGDPEWNAAAVHAVVSELTPTFGMGSILPMIEVMVGSQGYSFYWDREIVPRRDKDLPVGMQGAERSSRTARALGRALGYPPAKIDHLIRGFFAGTGHDIVRTVADPIAGILVPSVEDYGGSVRREDWPIIRRWVDRETEGRTEVVERFYEEFDEIERAYNGLEELEQIHGKDSQQYKDFKIRNATRLYVRLNPDGTTSGKPNRYKSMAKESRKLSGLWIEIRQLHRDATDPDVFERENLRIEREIKARIQKYYQRLYKPVAPPGPSVNWRQAF
jgi:hypothetical protein